MIYHEAMRLRNEQQHNEDTSLFAYVSVLAHLIEEKYQLLYSAVHKQGNY